MNVAIVASVAPAVAFVLVLWQVLMLVLAGLSVAWLGNFALAGFCGLGLVIGLLLFGLVNVCARADGEQFRTALATLARD